MLFESTLSRVIILKRKIPKRYPCQSLTLKAHDYLHTARVAQACHVSITRKLTNDIRKVQKTKEITVAPPFLLLSSTAHEILKNLFPAMKSEIQIHENLFLQNLKNQKSSKSKLPSAFSLSF